MRTGNWANVRQELLLRAGDPASHKQWGPQWLWIALGLLARGESKRRVGGIRSEPVGAAYLARKREEGRTVQTLLDEAEQHCRFQHWPEARSAWLNATKLRAFNWEAAEFSMSALGEGAPVGNLRFQAALSFKRAGDEASFQRLCDEPTLPGGFREPLGRMIVSLDFSESANRVLLFDHGTMFHPEPNMGGPEWRTALSAFADYAAGRGLETEPATFGAAAEMCYHWGRQTVGLALGAATLAKLERHAEAAEWFARAEAKWKELDENNRPDRAWHWPELTLCELASDEARRQLGGGNPLSVIRVIRGASIRVIRGQVSALFGPAFQALVLVRPRFLGLHPSCHIAGRWRSTQSSIFLGDLCTLSRLFNSGPETDGAGARSVAEQRPLPSLASFVIPGQHQRADRNRIGTARPPLPVAAFDVPTDSRRPRMGHSWPL